MMDLSWARRGGSLPALHHSSPDVNNMAIIVGCFSMRNIDGNKIGNSEDYKRGSRVILE